MKHKVYSHTQGKISDQWEKVLFKSLVMYLFNILPKEIRCPECEEKEYSRMGACNTCRQSWRHPIPLSEIL